MFRRFLWIALLLPTAALADSVTLEVGATQQVNVGIARGLACDDNAIVSASIETDPKSQTNVVTLTGFAVGSTTCRAGSVALGATRVLEITVTPTKPKVPGASPKDKSGR